MNTPNESPFSNPKFLIAIIITFLGLWGWQYYMNTVYPPAPAVTAPAGDNVGEKTVQNSALTAKKTDATTEKNAANVAEAAQAEIKPVEEKTFNYEDDKVKWVVSSEGLGVKSLTLKTYKDHSKKQIEFYSDNSNFSLFINNQRVSFAVTPVSDVEFRGEGTVDGKRIVRTLKYDKEKMLFESQVVLDDGLKAISFLIEDKKLKVSGGNFLMPSFERQDFLYREADKIVAEPISALDENEKFNKTVSNVSLASMGTQYFTLALVDKSEMVPSANLTVDGNMARVNVNYDLTNSQVRQLNQLYYIGAKDTDILKRIDPLMPEVMDYGVFGFIAKLLLKLMKFMYSVFGNWGLAIIGLTLVVRILLLPFNVMSFKSARAMQKIQPILKDIRERYKNDPLKVNRETMAVMKEHKANPLSGCLPMFIQIPIFFALWKTIGSSVEIYQQPFFGWITDLSSHDPFFVIPVLMGITMYFQQKLTPTTMDPTQQKILNFMPIIFTVFMLSLPSGLTLYNFVSALFGVIQQYFLMRDKSAKAA